MQNRLATAILMAVGGNLANREVSGLWTKAETYKFLDDVSDTVSKLLKGEKLEFSGYPSMQLTRDNNIQRSYNDVAAEFLEADVVSYDNGGYNE